MAVLSFSVKLFNCTAKLTTGKQLNDSQFQQKIAKGFLYFNSLN